MARTTRGKASDSGENTAVTWATLRAASEASGVSVSGLRKWYRNESIRSETREGPNGPQRVVALEDVMARADRLTAVDDLPPRGDIVQTGRGVLISVDAWDRMMGQLNNLYEAGQQLAKAEGRAARAETHAEHLRDRVADLQRRLDQARVESPAPEGARTVGRARATRKKAANGN